MQEGDRVELLGLESSPALNGNRGRIIGYKGDRVIVVIDGSGKVRICNTNTCSQPKTNQPSTLYAIRRLYLNTLPSNLNKNTSKTLPEYLTF